MGVCWGGGGGGGAGSAGAPTCHLQTGHLVTYGRGSRGASEQTDRQCGQQRTMGADLPHQQQGGQEDARALARSLRLGANHPGSLWTSRSETAWQASKPLAGKLARLLAGFCVPGWAYRPRGGGPLRYSAEGPSSHWWPTGSAAGAVPAGKSWPSGAGHPQTRGMFLNVACFKQVWHF